MKKEEIIKFIENSLKQRNYNIRITEKNLNLSIKDAKIDSLLAFSIITDLEKKIGKQISDSELLKIKTLNDLLKIFEKV